MKKQNIHVLSIKMLLVYDLFGLIVGLQCVMNLKLMPIAVNLFIFIEHILSLLNCTSCIKTMTLKLKSNAKYIMYVHKYVVFNAHEIIKLIIPQVSSSSPFHDFAAFLLYCSNSWKTEQLFWFSSLKILKF